MGLIRTILGLLLRGSGNNRQSQLLSAVVGMLGNSQTGGLSGLVSQFGAQGLGKIAESWVGTGANLPITPQQLRQGLGSQAIGQLSQKLGLAPDRLASQLSALLPQVVDRLTPQGQIPPTQDIASKGMDMLKGFLK